MEDKERMMNVITSGEIVLSNKEKEDIDSSIQEYKNKYDTDKEFRELVDKWNDIGTTPSIIKTVSKDDVVMFGTMIRDFRILDLNFLEEGEYDEEDVIIFNKGEIVEIVRELEDESFASGKGYLILSDEYESITVDISFVELIKK